MILYDLLIGLGFAILLSGLATHYKPTNPNDTPTTNAQLREKASKIWNLTHSSVRGWLVLVVILPFILAILLKSYIPASTNIYLSKLRNYLVYGTAIGLYTIMIMLIRTSLG